MGHPDELFHETEEMYDVKCMICLLVIDTPRKMTNCSHHFCEDCLQEWLSEANTCPQCVQERHDVVNETTQHKRTHGKMDGGIEQIRIRNHSQTWKREWGSRRSVENPETSRNMQNGDFIRRQLKEEQEKDEELKEIIDFFTKGNTPKGMNAINLSQNFT